MAEREAGGRGRPSRRSSSASALIVFGALFVVLFVGFAIAQGIGAARASPPATSRSSSTSPTTSARSAKPNSNGPLLQQVAQAEAEKSAEAGQQKIRRTEDSGAGRTARHDLDPGRGRRTRDLGDPETDRNRTRADQKNELPNRGRVPGIPQDLALHPGRRQRPGRSCSCSAPRSRKRSPNEAPPAVERRNLRLLRRQPRRPSTRPTESRDVRVIVNKDKAKVEAAQSGARKRRLGGELEKSREEILVRPDDESQRRPADGV